MNPFDHYNPGDTTSLDEFMRLFGAATQPPVNAKNRCGLCYGTGHVTIHGEPAPCVACNGSGRYNPAPAANGA